MPAKSQNQQTTNQVALLTKPPLLITESADEFAALLAALRQEIEPNGIIEQIYLEDLAAMIWEIHRMRRYRTGIVNNAFRLALKSLLKRLLVTDISSHLRTENRASELADAWFNSERAKQEVLAILRRFDLDESSIEAEAIRLSWSDLELIDEMQTSLRSRLDKALRSIADYRQSLAKLMRQSSDRILENDDILGLENFASEGSA